VNIFEPVEGTCQMLGKRMKFAGESEIIRLQLTPQPFRHWLLKFPNLTLLFRRSKPDVLFSVIRRLASENRPFSSKAIFIKIKQRTLSS